jgi:ABC-type phosphate transport system substrate-binding protein
VEQDKKANMNPTRRRALCLIASWTILASAPVPAAEFAADYQIIVNAANPTPSLTRDQVRKIFLKKMVKWDSGTPILPVDQVASSPVRAVFTKVVHEKTVGAISSYWQQQIFAGRDVPPAEKSTDAAVVAFVKANPGAIGYVAGGTAGAGFKILTVK